MPMRSPLTLLTASRRLSTRLAISRANRLRLSSRVRSASSRRRQSSSSPGERVTGSIRRKALRTGEEPTVLEERREVRYARKVRRFLSRANPSFFLFRDEGLGGTCVSEPSQESTEFGEMGEKVSEGKLREFAGAELGAVTVVRSLAGGNRMFSSGYRLASCAAWLGSVEGVEHGQRTSLASVLKSP